VCVMMYGHLNARCASGSPEAINCGERLCVRGCVCVLCAFGVCSDFVCPLLRTPVRRLAQCYRRKGKAQPRGDQQSSEKAGTLYRFY
jgi:hypothetical protein